MFLPLKWDSKQLESVLDKRVSYLVRQTYTKKSVGHKDLLPAKIDKKRTIDYIIERTLMRPREMIEFFNNCIEQAEDRTSVTIKLLRNAESQYSKNRLRSLGDEWFSDYPSLIRFTFILRKRQSKFQIKEIPAAEIEDWCLEYTVDHLDKNCSLAVEARKVAEGVIAVDNFLFFLFHVFYRTGVVGLKLETFERILWCFDGPNTIAAKTITENARVAVHPAFWRVLGIQSK